MAFDGIVTTSVISELNKCLINGKINKIYQPSKNDLSLNIYSNSKNYCLNICIDPINCRLHLTTHAKQNALVASGFCMLLRKHLVGCKIKSINNYKLERLVILELEGYNELNDLITKKLIIELMGKHSNIILLNEKNIILDSVRHLDTSSNSYRDILPAHPYEFPKVEKYNFLDIKSFEDFLHILISLNANTIFNSENNTYIFSNTIDIIISNTFNGFSRVFIQYILQTLNITCDHKIMTVNILKDIYNYCSQIIKNIGTSSIFCVTFNVSNTKKDYSLTLTNLKNKDNNDIIINNKNEYINNDSNLIINSFLNTYYYNKEKQETFLNNKNNVFKIISTALKKYEKRLENIYSKLEECKSMDKYKLYGELLTANLYRLKDKSKHNFDKITLENYYDDNKEITIPLDNTINISLNIQKFFKKYNKLKNTLSIVETQREQTEKELNYLQSVVYELEQSKTNQEIEAIYSEIIDNVLPEINNKQVTNKNKLKKNNKTKKITHTDIEPLQFKIDDYTILVGKNNKQNDQLTLKVAHKNDLWFHTKQIHGSHVILKTEGKTISNDIIIKCAKVAAYYSKAQNSSNVPVDYTYVKNIKKPSGSKPGMVIYINYKTIQVTPPRNITDIIDKIN